MKRDLKFLAIEAESDYVLDLVRRSRRYYQGRSRMVTASEKSAWFCSIRKGSIYRLISPKNLPSYLSHGFHEESRWRGIVRPWIDRPILSHIERIAANPGVATHASCSGCHGSNAPFLVAHVMPGKERLYLSEAKRLSETRRLPVQVDWNRSGYFAISYPGQVEQLGYYGRCEIDTHDKMKTALFGRAADRVARRTKAKAAKLLAGSLNSRKKFSISQRRAMRYWNLFRDSMAAGHGSEGRSNRL